MPMQLLYADPEYSGALAIVDFEDWEHLPEVRPIHYL